jgi:hypothetical protein
VLWGTSWVGGGALLAPPTCPRPRRTARPRAPPAAWTRCEAHASAHAHTTPQGVTVTHGRLKAPGAHVCAPPLQQAMLLGTRADGKQLRCRFCPVLAEKIRRFGPNTGDSSLSGTGTGRAQAGTTKSFPTALPRILWMPHEETGIATPQRVRVRAGRPRHLCGPSARIARARTRRRPNTATRDPRRCPAARHMPPPSRAVTSLQPRPSASAVSGVPSELSASPSERIAAPSELLASPSEL